MKKDTIYIDIEDDITAIIDKLKNAKSKVVALVPPKRSTSLNSAVNLKLLKKAADEADKRAVLVTSEPALLSLAGGVGMYVVANLHSKPYIPEREASPQVDDSVIDGSEVDPATPIGELDAVHSAGAAAKEGKKPKPAKAKTGFKIPNFDSFRNKLFLIIGGILLLAGIWWWAFYLSPKAIVAIDAQTSAVDISIEFVADTNATEEDFDKNIFPAEAKSLTSSVSQQFAPTGKKNVGDKASGQVTVLNEDGVAHDIAAGTIMTSPGGLKFETLEAITAPAATVCPGGGVCPSQTPVNVRAVGPGTDYNLASGTTYDIDGVGSLVSGQGGQMSGGTDKNVTVVAQKDIDEAKKDLNKQDNPDGVSTMREEFDQDRVPINETYRVRIGNVSASPDVGQEADTAAITAESTQSMLGLKRQTLAKVLDDFLSARLEGGDQIIYRNGLDELSFEVLEGPKDGKTELRLTTTGYIGPDLDTDQLARDIEGMRYSEAVKFIESRPGVIKVDVNFEPFWVFSTPRPEKVEFILNVDQSG